MLWKDRSCPGPKSRDRRRAQLFLIQYLLLPAYLPPRAPPRLCSEQSMGSSQIPDFLSAWWGSLPGS